MSFGSLNDMLSKTQKLLKNHNTKNISLSELFKIRNDIFDKLKLEFSSITMNIVEELLNRLFQRNYNLAPTLCFDGGKNCFREFEDIYVDIEVPDEYKALEKQFNKLKNLPQPAQRSKEWYEYRNQRITASDTAAAIDLNPYEPVESFIYKKCDPDHKFYDNDAVCHGKKYEPVATMIYEHIYNIRVFEFGALPSEKYNFLGASPDGICSKYTLDNKFSKRLGVMLEIKCPITRKIITKGKINGEICPTYYYYQVQQQLACCELETCDFWQCNLIEYKSRDEYLTDQTIDTIHTIGTNSEEISIDNRLKKGAIIEFLPKVFNPEFEGDKHVWKSKYIYPKRLDMNEEQYDNWVMHTMANLNELYPDIVKDYYFHKIIYWKLGNSHNVDIKRDDNLMESILPLLRDTWSRVGYYRNNLDKLPELKEIIEKRKKYIRMNMKYKIHNDNLISNKSLFLDKSFDNKSFIKNNSDTPSYSSYSNYSNKTNETTEKPKRVYKKKSVEKEVEKVVSKPKKLNISTII